MGIGYVRKTSRLTTGELELSQVLIAPFGDDPVIVSETTVQNRGSETLEGLSYTETWPTQWSYLEAMRELVSDLL